MILGIPLTIWLGILTALSLFTTFSLGIALHVFRKNVFKYHRFFAILTVFLVLIHITLAFLLWFKQIII
jgi:hypothetical protein